MLSSLNRELLDLLRRGALPTDTRLVPVELAPYLCEYHYHYSPWPVYINAAESQRLLAPLLTQMTRILYTSLRVRFGRDSAAFADYFGWPAGLYDYLRQFPVDPRDVFLRYDAVFANGDIRLLETNAGSSAGGWQLGDWPFPLMREMFSHDPRSAAWPIGGDTTVACIFRFLIASMRRRNGARRGGHILVHDFTESQESRDSLLQYLQQVYDQCKPRGWPDGKVFLYREFDELTFPDNGDLCKNGQRMDAIITTFHPAGGEFPADAAAALNKAYLIGRVVYPDSPLHMLLSDKRLFSLVHECCREGLFSEADQALVQRFVPWTAVLGRERQRWRDEDAPLVDILLRHRAAFVVKPADSFGGKGVQIGHELSDERWREAIEHSLTDGRWIVQEYCAPGRMELHDGLRGIAEHELIWGLFVAGGEYAGIFLRARRCDESNGVINSSNGATEFQVFLDDRAPADIAAPLAAATAALSPLNLELATHLDPAAWAEGERLQVRTEQIPRFLHDYAFPVSAWPVFISTQIIQRDIEPLAAAFPALLYRAIAARFRSAPAAFEQYFGWPRALLDGLLQQPANTAATMIRYDAVIGAQGVRLLEINCCSSIGGWLLDWLAAPVQARLAALPAAGSGKAVYRSVFEHMLGHVLDTLQQWPDSAIAGNVLVHADSRADAAWLQSLQQALQQVYDRLRPARFSHGRILLCTRADDIEFGSSVRFDGQRIDAVLLSFAGESELSDTFYERLTAAALRRQVYSADGHFQRILGDKRLFALLHECLREGRLAADDAALVRRYIPWTARVVDGPSPDDENLTLPALLAQRRETLVLKKASSFGGKAVVVGARTATEEWARTLQRALAEGDWIAQIYCTPENQLVCAPGSGLSEHALIWGLFAFGGRYGGAFVRAQRSGVGDGVINSAAGATEFLVFEDRSSGAEAPAETPPLLETALSPLNAQLLEQLAQDASMRDEHIDLRGEDTVGFLRGWPLKLSAWPLLVAHDFARRRFARVVEAVPRVLYKAITAYFGNDRQAFADYFALPAVFYDLLRRRPVDLREVNARYDATLTAESLRILEINCSSAAGGFQHDWIAPAAQQILQRHATTRGWNLRRHAIFRSQLQALILAMLRGKPGRSGGNILMYSFVGEDARDSLEQELQLAYDAVRPASLAGGRLRLFTDFSSFAFTADGDVLYAGSGVDAVLFSFPDAVDVPEAVYEQLCDAYLRGRLVFPDSPFHTLLGSKRQFALAHDCVERGLLDEADADVVREFIPWSATLCEREVQWRGERIALSQLLRRERAQFVVKKAESFGGRDVVVGRHCSEADWEALLARHFDDRGWLVQEYCPSGQVRLYDPELGVCAHDLVWGIFTFGGRYGGTFLRGKPADASNGVINTANGATEILVFEQVETAAATPPVRETADLR